MEEKVRAARIKATYMYPYLSTALLTVTIHESTDVQTMAITQGGRIYWNPDFVATLTMDELTAVIVHEIWHMLRLHGERAPEDESLKGIYNIAGDCEIDDSLDGLPKDAIYPETFGLQGHLTVEEYFEQLVKNAVKIQCAGVASGDCGSGARGGKDKCDKDDKASTKVLTRLDKELIARHTAEQIRAIGNVPENIARWADALLNPKVPWERELRSKFMSCVSRALGKTDYTYARRSRRASVTRAILPGMVSYKPKVAVVMDTSGSMENKQLSRCLVEIKDLLRALADRVTVYVTDAAIHSVNTVSSIGEIKLAGGGGTDMRIGIQEAEKCKPDIIVVLSDFLTPWPTHKPRPEVIGVCISGEVTGAPGWMKTIQINEGN